MSVVINAASVDFDLITNKAVADVTAGNRIVVFHLTEGFDLFKVEDQGAEPTAAFSGIGHFKVALGAGDSLAGWKIGVVQLAKLHEGSAFYAGRIRNEGSVSVIFKNAMPSPLLLDSRKDRTPFTRPAPQCQLDGNEVTCPTSDHPALKVPKEQRNSGRNIQNFLFHVLDDREFWSVLTAIDPQGKRQHLAHFHWQISHNVKFNWVGGRPVVASKNSTFTLHGKAKGPPPDADLQGLLADPQPPQFNEAADQAMLQSFRGARGPNLRENDFWFNNVPPNFFS